MFSCGCGLIWWLSRVSCVWCLLWTVSLLWVYLVCVVSFMSLYELVLVLMLSDVGCCGCCVRHETCLVPRVSRVCRACLAWIFFAAAAVVVVVDVVVGVVVDVVVGVVVVVVDVLPDRCFCCCCCCCCCCCICPIAPAASVAALQESAKDPVAFVQGLLTLRDKYDCIVNDAFRAEKRSQKRLKEVGGRLLRVAVLCFALLSFVFPLLCVDVLCLASVRNRLLCVDMLCFVLFRFSSFALRSVLCLALLFFCCLALPRWFCRSFSHRLSFIFSLFPILSFSKPSLIRLFYLPLTLL